MSVLATRTVIGPENRREWLAARRTFIGASEAYRVCKGNRVQVYLEKTGQIEPEPESIPMRMGLALEPVIAELYEETGLGRIASRQVFIRREGAPYIAATIDGIKEDGNLVEFKYASEGRYHEFGCDGSDDVPEPWLFQAQQQMAVSHAEIVDFAVLCGPDFRWFRVHRHEPMIDGIARIEERFWAEHVEPRKPPRPDENTPVEHVLALYPDPRSWTFLDPTVASLVDNYVHVKQLRRDHEKEVERLRSLLIQELGEFEEGHLPDGRIVRRSFGVRQIKATPAKQSITNRLDVITPRP